MKSHGGIEAANRKGMTIFEQEYVERAPKNLQAHLIHDLLVVYRQIVSDRKVEERG